MSARLLTAEQWQVVLGVYVLDPDGWREPGAPEWLTPISRVEFIERAGRSTANWRNFDEGSES